MTVTVAELRELIAELPAEMEVCVAYHVEAPSTQEAEEDGYFIDGELVQKIGVDGVPGQAQMVCLWAESFFEGVAAL